MHGGCVRRGFDQRSAAAPAYDASGCGAAPAAAAPTEVALQQAHSGKDALVGLGDGVEDGPVSAQAAGERAQDCGVVADYLAGEGEGGV